MRVSFAQLTVTLAEVESTPRDLAYQTAAVGIFDFFDFCSPECGFPVAMPDKGSALPALEGR